MLLISLYYSHFEFVIYIVNFALRDPLGGGGSRPTADLIPVFIMGFVSEKLSLVADPL